MSLIQWGNDTIGMGRVLDYRVTSLLSDDGIDYIATRYDVDFQGVVSLDLGGANPVAAAKIMQERMLQPRKAFRLYISDYTTAGLILESGAPDINGGPKCNNVTFSQFQGSRTAICNANFTIFKHDCNTQSPTVLSNRWATNSVIDQDYYTRLTVTGELRVNPYRKFGADTVRDQCFRGVPQGMQPVSASFLQSTDGLRLNYSIIFQEKYQLPPGVATDLKAEYSETSESGANVVGEMYCDVTGAKSAAKSALFQIAASVVNSRFDFGANPPQPGKDMFLGGVMREIMHDNRVSVVLRGIKANAKQLQGIGPLRIDPNVFGKPIPFAPIGKGEQIPVWGNGGANGGYAAVAAAWKSFICVDPDPVSPNAQAPLSFVGNSEVPGLTYQQGDLPSPVPDKTSPGNQQYPYIPSHGFRNHWGNDHYIDTQHFIHPGLYIMPNAKKGAPLSSVDGLDGGPKKKHVSVVRLHQPLAKKLITYRLTRMGRPPEQPVLSYIKPGVTVIWHDFKVKAPYYGPDGVIPVYEATGKLWVAYHTGVDVTTDSIRLAVDPMTVYDIEVEGTISPSHFNNELLEGSP